MLIDVLGVLRDISLLVMCLGPALVFGGLGIYLFFVLRPWTKVDQVNDRYVVTNIRKGVDLTEKASSTTESVGRKVTSPLISLYSAAAGAQAFIETLRYGTREPALFRPPSRLQAVRAERKSRMAERRQNRREAQELQRLQKEDAAASGSQAAAEGRIDAYGQQPSAPSLPRTAPGSVNQTVENMLDTADANPMLNLDQRGDESATGTTDGAAGTRQPLIEPAVGLNQTDGVISSDPTGTTTSRSVGDVTSNRRQG